MEGHWISDKKQLELMVTNYYKNMFNDNGVREASCMHGAFPALSEDDLAMLNREVSRSDNFNVVKHMGAYKAPGIDGFQAVFFQSQWHVVGESFCSLVLAFLETRLKCLTLMRP